MISLSYDSLMPKVLRFLAFRRRSRQEIEQYLKKKTEERILIDSVIKRLEEMNYINDSAFAEWFVQSYTGNKAKGRSVLSYLLKQKGISDEIIQTVLQNNPRDEVEQMRHLLEKKGKTLHGLPTPVQKKRLLSYLLRRGFSGSSAYRLVDEYTQNTYNTR